VERIREHQPSAVLLRADARFQVPVPGTVCLIDLILVEMHGLQIGAGEMIESEGKSGIFLDFLVAGNQAVARAADQERDLCVDANQFEGLARDWKEPRREEEKPERDPRRLELRA
jgi:hypothetical protein